MLLLLNFQQIFEGINSKLKCHSTQQTGDSRTVYGNGVILLVLKYLPGTHATPEKSI
jgi:hypothetical protein